MFGSIELGIEKSNLKRYELIKLTVITKESANNKAHIFFLSAVINIFIELL